MKKSEFMKSEELAKLLDVHVNTLGNWRRDSVGPKYLKIDIGTRPAYFYKRSDVEEWIESNMIQTAG